MSDRQSAVDWFPDLVLLLGTDASGKNYVARRLVDGLRERGRTVVVREGRLAADPDREDDDSKSFLSHLAEATFLRVFPLLQWFLPAVLAALMRRDAKRYRRQADGTQFIVSHTALRVLAFIMGCHRSWSPSRRLSPSMERAVRRLRPHSRTVVIVLDVDDKVRQARIAKRIDQDDVDPFDKFMAADSDRSERIESCMVWLAETYLSASVIENNNLDDEALWQLFRQACDRGRSID